MTGARFHLAWFKLNTDFFMSGRRLGGGPA